MFRRDKKLFKGRRMDNAKGQRLPSHVRSAFSCSISCNLTGLFEALKESRRAGATSAFAVHRTRRYIARIRKVHISGAICSVIAAGANAEDSPIIRNCRLLSRARDRIRPESTPILVAGCTDASISANLQV